MRKIIFLDLDGTLWHNGKIPESAKIAIQIAQKNGHKIILNTGRTKSSVSHVVFDLNLDGYCFGTGSHIEIDKKTIEYHPLQKDVVQFLKHELDKRHIFYFLEGRNKNYSMFHKNIDYENIQKILIVSRRNLDWLPDNLCATSCGKLGVEITQKQYNKASAIQTILDYYGHDYISVSIGDSANDIPMFEMADTAIGMGNGSKSIHPYVDDVTSHIKKKGLYNAFCRLQLI